MSERRLNYYRHCLLCNKHRSQWSGYDECKHVSLEPRSPSTETERFLCKIYNLGIRLRVKPGSMETLLTLDEALDLSVVLKETPTITMIQADKGLDGAIEYARDVAMRNPETNSAHEYTQIAEWLEELKFQRGRVQELTRGDNAQ